MIAVDTNIVLRVLLDDDLIQLAAVKKLLAGREPGSVRVSLIVLAELAWTLQRKLKRGRVAVIEAVERLLARIELHIENRDAVVTAIEWFGQGQADFNDYLIAALNAQAGATPTYTFDQNAEGHPAFAAVPT